jgi:hypothetical protein
MSAWRARERLHDVIHGNEGASFNLIPDWLLRVETAEADTANGYLHLEITDTRRFEALFMMFGAVRATLSCLRPFYALEVHILDHDTTLRFYLRLELMLKIVFTL